MGQTRRPETLVKFTN